MLERIRSNGVVGAGGAGFPTYKKLERAVDTVILNAAECEPLLHKDKELLRRFGDEILDGMAQIRRQVGAERSIVAIKNKYRDLIEELGRKGGSRGIEVHELGDYYPAGDEFITVFEVTGRVIPPGGLPGDVGCVVSNVETVLNVQLDQPVTHKYLTVAGAVPEPCTVCAPLGASFGDVLRGVGVDPAEVGHVLVGGVMMGQLMESFDQPITRTTGGLICFPEGHGLVRRYLADSRTRSIIGKSACDQCSFCTELCPRYLIGHPVRPHLAMRGLEFNMAGEAIVLDSQFCCECNLCSLYSCPEDLFPKDACADNKVLIREQGLRHPETGRTDARAHSMQPYRHVPLTSLIKKLGLTDFRNVGPLVDVDWNLERVRIPLRQHVGAPAEPVVQRGDHVEVGQVIGRAPEGLGVPMHASLAGEVVTVSSEVEIRRS